MKLIRLKLHLGIVLFTSLISLSGHSTTQVINGSATIQDLKSLTPVALNYELMDVSDPDITFDGVSKLTVSQNGKYQIRYAVNWGVNSKRRRQIKTYILKNSSHIIPHSTSYSYAKSNSVAKYATNSGSVTLQLNQGDYLEIMAVGELGDGTSLGGGTALTVDGESVFSVEALDTDLTAAAGTTFEKCQVKHHPTPTYPSCPEGFAAIHSFSKARIRMYDWPTVKHAFGMYPSGMEDNTWFYAPYQQYEPNRYQIESTLACSICAAE